MGKRYYGYYGQGTQPSSVTCWTPFLLTSHCSKEFEFQTWDEYSDICSVKKSNRTEKAVKVKPRRLCGACNTVVNKFFCMC